MGLRLQELALSSARAIILSVLMVSLIYKRVKGIRPANSYSLT